MFEPILINTNCIHRVRSMSNMVIMSVLIPVIAAFNFLFRVLIVNIAGWPLISYSNSFINKPWNNKLLQSSRPVMGNLLRFPCGSVILDNDIVSLHCLGGNFPLKSIYMMGEWHVLIKFLRQEQAVCCRSLVVMLNQDLIAANQLSRNNALIQY